MLYDGLKFLVDAWRGTRILRVVFTGGTPVPLLTNHQHYE